MKTLLVLFTCVSLNAATISVAAPTGVAATDKAALSTATGASGSGDTIQFSGAGITAHPTCAVSFNSTAMTCSSGAGITNGQKVWAWGITEGVTVASGGGTVNIVLSSPASEMIPSGTTVAFGAAYNFTGGGVPALSSDHRTYTCAVPSTCVLDLGNNSGGMTTTTTRNTMTISNLWVEGCGINTNTGNSNTYFVGFTFTGNQFFNCRQGSTFLGSFLTDNWGWNGSIDHNTFANGGCFLGNGTCDGAFVGVLYYHVLNLVIDSNQFILNEEGMHQVLRTNFDGSTAVETGHRITNNVFSRGHRMFIEEQGWYANGTVYAGNHTGVSGWEMPYFNSWCISLAINFGGGPADGVNYIVQNNVCDSRNMVQQDGVTFQPNAGMVCWEIGGTNITMDSNQCLNLTTAPSGLAAWFTGFASSVLSGTKGGTISNNCWGGFFESPNTNNAPNYYTFGDGGTPQTSAFEPTIQNNNLTPPSSSSCPGVSTTPTITTTSLPAGVTSQPYSTTVQVSGGTAPYTWSISVGALPTGLTIGSSTGTISGTPSAGGTSFTVRVVDANSNAAILATSITINSAAGVTSDQFNGSSVNLGLWTIVDPVGGSSITEGGGNLSIAVAGGALHDPSFGGANNAVQLVQTISGNFTAIAKFNSFPTAQYSFEGIEAIQDSSNYIYFQIGSDGVSTQLGAISIIAGATTLVGGVTSFTPGAFECLSMTQAGTSWTLSYSADCLNFTVLSTFTQALSVVKVGPWAGNYNDSAPAAPAFTALVDYFVNAVIPDMTVTMTHSGSFSQSQVGATYTITATNGGGGATISTVSTATTLPIGLNATGISGTGWTCTLSSLICTRSDSLAASGSYPAITLAVNVAANAGTPLVPSTVVSGGGESNTANDSVTDSTTITAVVVTPHVISVTMIGVTASGFPTVSIEDTSGNVIGNSPCNFTLTASSAAYVCNVTTLPTTNIRVVFVNGTTGALTARTMNVTAFTLDGNATSPISPTVFTLSHSAFCRTGFLQNQQLRCGGYMEFPLVNSITAIDTTPPSQPTNLVATALQAGTIQLTWTASVDDVAVVGYRVIRNGSFYSLSTPTTYTDTAPGKASNTYSLIAFDAANNSSVTSASSSTAVGPVGTGVNGTLYSLGGGVDFSGATLGSIPCLVSAGNPLSGTPGSCVYNTTTQGLNFWNSTLASWIPLGQHSIAYNFDTASCGGGAAIVAPCATYIRVPISCVLNSFSIVTSPAGSTATVQVWDVVSGSALPTVANQIGTLSGGVVTSLTTVAAFTATSLNINDIMAFNISAITGAPTQVNATIQCSN